jgi:hypothetical protein
MAFNAGSYVFKGWNAYTCFGRLAVMQEVATTIGLYRSIGCGTLTPMACDGRSCGVPAMQQADFRIQMV